MKESKLFGDAGVVCGTIASLDKVYRIRIETYHTSICEGLVN